MCYCSLHVYSLSALVRSQSCWIGNGIVMCKQQVKHNLLDKHCMAFGKVGEPSVYPLDVIFMWLALKAEGFDLSHLWCCLTHLYWSIQLKATICFGLYSASLMSSYRYHDNRCVKADMYSLVLCSLYLVLICDAVHMVRVAHSYGCITLWHHWQLWSVVRCNT